jgi:hypothetical protein
METIMVRMLSLVAVACVALCSTALTPTLAADWHGGDQRILCNPCAYPGPPVSYGYGNCYVRELWQTPWGPRWRLVNRCP